MSPAGRPKAENPKSNRFSIRLDAETENRLKEYCEKYGITNREKGKDFRRALLAKEKE